MKEIILIKNGELALKGLNRCTFEDILVKNIKRRLSDLGAVTVKKSQSTIYIEPNDDDFDFAEALERVSLIFGIAGFSRACVCEKDINDILTKSVEYLKESLENVKHLKLRQNALTSVSHSPLPKSAVNSAENFYRHIPI